MPGRDHLDSIKALLYSSPQAFEEKLFSEKDLVEASLQMRSTGRVRRQLTLDRDDANNLLTMTPYMWHASKESRQNLQDMDQLQTTVDVNLATYEKRA